MTRMRYLIAGVGAGLCAAPTAQTTARTRCRSPPPTSSKPGAALADLGEPERLVDLRGHLVMDELPTTRQSRSNDNPILVLVAFAALRPRHHLRPAPGPSTTRRRGAPGSACPTVARPRPR